MSIWDGNGLPPIAAQRLERAAKSGVATSLLSVPGHLGVRAAGLEPVGEVMGCTVLHLGWAGYGGCGWVLGSLPPQGTVIAGRSRYSGFGPYVEAIRGAWARTLERMTAECAALGADGVVGVRLEDRPLGEGARELVALGTAVRSSGSVHPSRPFTTTLGGIDVAKLIAAGYSPASIVIGISVGIRHDDWQTVSSTMLGAGNVEVPGYTDLVHTVRDDVRRELSRLVREIGANGAILTEAMSLTIGEVEPGEGHRDHVAEARLVACAITGSGSPPPTSTLRILPLSPMRRRNG